MSVMKALTCVILMLSVPTPLEASPVPVTKDTLEMEQLVMVSYLLGLIINLRNTFYRY